MDEQNDILSQRFNNYRATGLDDAPIGSGPFYNQALYGPVLRDMKHQYQEEFWPKLLDKLQRLAKKVS